MVVVLPPEGGLFPIVYEIHIHKINADEINAIVMMCKVDTYI